MFGTKKFWCVRNREVCTTDWHLVSGLVQSNLNRSCLIRERKVMVTRKILPPYFRQTDWYFKLCTTIHIEIYGIDMITKLQWGLCFCFTVSTAVYLWRQLRKEHTAVLVLLKTVYFIEQCKQWKQAKALITSEDSCLCKPFCLVHVALDRSSVDIKKFFIHSYLFCVQWTSVH